MTKQLAISGYVHKRSTGGYNFLALDIKDHQTLEHFWTMEAVQPFNIRKAEYSDQNTAWYEAPAIGKRSVKHWSINILGIG